MQKAATDILGLEYKEIRPILNIKKSEKKKKVGLGIHSTAQSKYWNNPKGWQEVVDYLISKGYEVILYSRENDGHMGNKHPMGINKFKGDGSIESVMNDLSTCEFFIGIGSGLSWLSWSIGLPTLIISGFSEEYSETSSNTWRVINKSVCHGCFNWNRLDASDWNWCPVYKGSDKAFECSKEISSKMVIEKIEDIMLYQS
jgi:autotransporter strand-loop-strand O-heptosyltransferase